MKEMLHKAINIILGGFLLCFWALYNRFPLVFADTGTYLSSGFTNNLPADRPIFYGWFLRHSSLWESLYLPVFLQSLFLAYLLWYWVIYFGSSHFRRAQYLSLVGVLTFFTSASIQASQLIPDLFAATTLLSLGLLLLVEKLTSAKKIVFGLCLFGSLLMHNSHVLIVWTSLLLLVVLNGWRYLKGIEHLFSRGWWIVLGVLLIAQLTLPATNWLNGHGFRSSRAAHVFLMNRMVTWGITDQYLKANCPEKAYIFCEYKDKIPANNFLWDYNNSPLYKTGGWEANEQEYNVIIADILKSPQYYPQFLFRSLENTGQQFFSFDLGDTAEPNHKGSLPQIIVSRYFPELERFYYRSLQQEGHLDLTTLNVYHRLLVTTCMVLAFILVLNRRNKWLKRGLLETILIVLLANAAVCGILSGVFDRYQCRMVFVLVIPFYLALWKLPAIRRITEKNDADAHT